MSLTADERADAEYLLCIALETPEEIRAAEDLIGIAADRCRLALLMLGALAEEPEPRIGDVMRWAQEYASASMQRRDCRDALAEGLEAAEALAALRRAEVAA